MRRGHLARHFLNGVDSSSLAVKNPRENQATSSLRASLLSERSCKLLPILTILRVPPRRRKPWLSRRTVERRFLPTAISPR
jgi:hypothetical protein